MSNKKVRVGSLLLGDGKIYIQSMLNVRSDDVDGSVAQAVRLEQAGCDIIRAAVPDKEAVRLIPAIKDCILKVDIDARVMTVHLLEGLR